ncbi:MAG: hypothetical protein HYX82_00980 [Chloroflexi bacterium]|nr:hypothetical protein [Chloroflexota bacterium]
MRRDLDDILNKCIDRLIAGESVEACLESYPDEARELEPLLLASSKALALGAQEPRPDFKASLRYRISSEFKARQKKRQRWSFLAHPWLRPWLATVSAFLVLLVIGGGAVQAASRSLPDQPLYPIKQVVERVQLAFTPSGAPKARLYAKLAMTRSEEIAEMVRGGKAELMEGLTQRIAENLENSQVHMGAPLSATLTDTKVRGPAGPAGVEGVIPTLSPEPQGAAFVAPPTQELTKQPIPLTKKGEEIEELKKILERNKERNERRFQEALKRAPERARPALERAYRATNAAYDRVILSLEEAQKQESESNEEKQAPGP